LTSSIGNSLTRAQEEIAPQIQIPLFGPCAEATLAGFVAPQCAGPARGTFWTHYDALRYADLFSGIGGFHQAAASLGMECVLACDIDAEARKAYRANYGLEPHHDIRSLDNAEVPDLEILLGGFPCQPFSIIGNQEGFADARGTLFFEIARIIKAKQPRAFLLENVRQLASHNHGETLKHILRILREDLGYTVETKVLNALHFGLPQKRERILIVGFKGKVTDFTWPSEKIPMPPLSEILETNVDKRHYVSERIKLARESAHTPKFKPAIWHENKAGNVSSHPFSCALRAGASHNYLLVDGERRLTSKEMLRLQGFPESFKIVCNDGQTRKQVGNAVPVPMVRAVLEKMLLVECA